MAKEDRMGKRVPREKFRTRVPDLGHYFIVTDTEETEKNYITGLKETLPKALQNRIVIKVSSTKTSRLVNECIEQASNDPQYAQPWIVFDRDKVPNFDEIIKKALENGVHVGWSNPCIEIWFDAYFGKMHPYMDSVHCCHGFSTTFQQKTGQEYSKANQQLYSILNRYGDEEAAIRYAETRLQGFEKQGNLLPSQMCPCTTLHHLVDEIRKKTSTPKGEK